MSSIPINIRVKSNYLKNRSGAKWKKFDNNYLIKKSSLVGNYRPSFNDDITLSSVGNNFRSIPLKHWRNQFGNTNGKQSYKNKNQIKQIDIPGGTSVNTNSNTDDCSNCDGEILLFNNYTLGKLNKTGRFNPIYNNSNNDSDNKFFSDAYINSCSNCNSDENIPKCINICDEPSKALKKIRTSTIVNSNKCNNTFYQSNSSYLKSRGRTFKQNSFNYELIDTGNSISAENSYNSAKYRSNNYTSCDSGNDCRKSSKSSYVYYKPNNYKFNNQGAVSSSSRLLRLKLNTINTSAKSIGDTFGKNTSNALAYSSNNNTPFIIKSKSNRCFGNVSRNKKYRCFNTLSF
jgi:hypothetical protein